MSQFTEQLKGLLKQDIADLASLGNLLELEKQTLKTRDSTRIDTLSKSKLEAIQKLESRAKLKATLLASSGLGISPGQVQTTLATLNDDELMDLWKSSTEQLAHCKDMNEINGNIIARSLQRTNRLMSIVRGQHKAPNLYSQKGRQESYSGSHKLGQA